MSKPSKIDAINNIDEPINEILGVVPRWIVRWGNTAILTFFIVLAIITYIIKYPETISTVGRITTNNPPQAIKVKNDGKITKLFIKDGDTVQYGTILGFLESTANHNDILELSEQVDRAVNLNNVYEIESQIARMKNKPLKLGELQTAFSEFNAVYVDYLTYSGTGLLNNKRALLKNDIDLLRKLSGALAIQKELGAQDEALTRESVELNELLNKEKILSNDELRAEYGKLLAKKLSKPLINKEIILNSIEQNAKQKEITDLNLKILQQKEALLEALRTLKSQVDEWKTKYVFVSETEGILRFPQNIQESRMVNTGEIICYITSEKSTYYIAAQIPQESFGKISLAQKVIVRLPSYPYQEFGTLTGIVDDVGHISNDSSGFYSVIKLPKGLKTSYNKEIYFRDGLVAQCDIITEDLRLIERFYYNIIKQIKR